MRHSVGNRTRNGKQLVCRPSRDLGPELQPLSVAKGVGNLGVVDNPREVVSVGVLLLEVPLLIEGVTQL